MLDTFHTARRRAMADDDERLREHPKDRFAPSVRHLNLAEEFEELLAEDHEAVDNHRQIALVKRGGLSIILFYFEEGGVLPEHRADAEVSIHVLAGELEIDTPDRTDELGEGELLVLAPDVEHDVEALEPSKMLLTLSTDRD